MDDLRLYGTPTYVWADSETFVESAAGSDPAQLDRFNGSVGATLRPSGAVPIAWPRVARRAIGFRAIAGARGEVHAFWGTSGSSRGGALHVDTVWHSVHDGNSWTSPEVILRSRGIHWFPESVGIAIDSGQPVVALPMHFDTGGSGVALLRTDGRHWTESRIAATTITPGFARLVVGQEGRLLIAFDGQPRGRPRDVDGIFVAREDSTGRYAIVRISALEHVAAQDAELFVSADGRARVIWSERRASGPPDRVKVSESTDGGRVWAQPVSFDLPARTRSVSSAFVEPEMILIAASEANGNALWLGRWTRAGLAAIAHPTFEPAMAPPVIVRAAVDTAYLMWGAGRSTTAGNQRIAGPELFLATITAACR